MPRMIMRMHETMYSIGILVTSFTEPNYDVTLLLDVLIMVSDFTDALSENGASGVNLLSG